MDASLMSCLLCLVSISVFIHVNFLLKFSAMLITAVAQIAIYSAVIRARAAVNPDDADQNSLA